MLTLAFRETERKREELREEKVKSYALKMLL